jgi:hypothetical protein
MVDLRTAATPTHSSNTTALQQDSVNKSPLFPLNSWDSMKSGFQNFGTRFAPLRQGRGSNNNNSPSSSQTLDSIFRSLQARRDANDDEDGLDLRLLG